MFRFFLFRSFSFYFSILFLIRLILRRVFYFALRELLPSVNVNACMYIVCMAYVCVCVCVLSLCFEKILFIRLTDQQLVLGVACAHRANILLRLVRRHR